MSKNGVVAKLTLQPSVEDYNTFDIYEFYPDGNLEQKLYDWHGTPDESGMYDGTTHVRWLDTKEIEDLYSLTENIQVFSWTETELDK